jgi:hypothetical protein
MAVQDWLGLVDRGAYAESWSTAAALLKRSADAATFAKAIEGARAPLGRFVSRRLENVKSATPLPDLPAGQYTSVVYDSSFEHADHVTETALASKEAGGQWRVAGYYATPVSCHGASAPTGLPPPPRTLGLDPFYEKYIDADGLPIVASAHVDDRALFAARDLAAHLFAKRHDAHAQIVRSRVRLAVVGSDERVTDVPEYADLAGTRTDTPGVDWNDRARGLGATRLRPVTSSSEENLLCSPCDRYHGESVLVHELGHTLAQIGLASDGDFQKALRQAYDEATKRGLWRGTYAATNVHEYWAEGVQDWFDANLHDVANHNAVHTRAQLAVYDPALHALLARVLPEDSWRYSCEEPHVAPPTSPAPAPIVSPAAPPAACPAGMVGLAGGAFVLDRGVTVQPFCIDATEVTVAAYAACARAGRCTAAAATVDWTGITPDQRARFSARCNGARGDRQDHPVNCVDSRQAAAFCRARGERLPTEEEWEWAARGGSSGFTYPWGHATPSSQLCWSSAEPRTGTCTVGSFAAGDAPGAVHDLAGNVWEWTASVTASGDVVQKGGAWDAVTAAFVRASASDEAEPRFRSHNVGFRCVK